MNRASLLKAFFFLVKDPSKTDRVFEIADRGREHRGPLVDQTVQAILKQDGFLELYRASYAPKVPPLAELATYPDGSFGRAFARHMQDNNLEIEFFPMPEGQGEETYLIERGRKSHDFWHVLAGFDTTVAGEIGLQAFTLAQIRSPFSAILLAGGLLHAILLAPEIFNDLIDQMFEGYQMGTKAKKLLGIPIETMLHENLDELRARFDIKARPVPHLTVSMNGSKLSHGRN